MAITYNNLYMDIRQELHRAGIQAATLEARELVCFAAGKTREQFVRDGRLYVPQDVEEQARALMRRHLAGEPLAYLIGEWEFYGLPLDISEQVLIPRSDTEVLAGEAIRWLQTQQDARVLDLCAGSGCVGLAVASQVHACRVVLGEKSEAALRICRQNIRRSGLLGRVTPMPADALEPPTRQLGEFDCIVWQPALYPDAGYRDARCLRCATMSRTWRSTAVRTGWNSTARSARTGAKRSTPAPGSISRSASGRRTAFCASCGGRASASWRLSQTRRAFPASCTAHCIMKFNPGMIKRRNQDYGGKERNRSGGPRSFR